MSGIETLDSSNSSWPHHSRLIDFIPEVLPTTLNPYIPKIEATVLFRT